MLLPPATTSGPEPPRLLGDPLGPPELPHEHKQAMGLLLLLLMVGVRPLLCGLLGSVVRRLQGRFREAWEVWGTKLGRFLKPLC